jgi:hypothetical protein
MRGVTLAACAWAWARTTCSGGATKWKSRSRRTARARALVGLEGLAKARPSVPRPLHARRPAFACPRPRLRFRLRTQVRHTPKRLQIPALPQARPLRFHQTPIVSVTGLVILSAPSGSRAKRGPGGSSGSPGSNRSNGSNGSKRSNGSTGKLPHDLPHQRPHPEGNSQIVRENGGTASGRRAEALYWSEEPGKIKKPESEHPPRPAVSTRACAVPRWTMRSTACAHALSAARTRPYTKVATFPSTFPSTSPPPLSPPTSPPPFPPPPCLTTSAPRMSAPRAAHTALRPTTPMRQR